MVIGWKFWLLALLLFKSWHEISLFDFCPSFFNIRNSNNINK